MIKIPSAAFRKSSVRETSIEYRLYMRGDGDRKFSWRGAFETKEDAQRVASRHCKNPGEEYVIKKVVVQFDEETCDQSDVLGLRAKLPELVGIF
jgi:hypothetical protein